MLDKISHKIVPTFNQKVELSGTFAGEPFVFSVKSIMHANHREGADGWRELYLSIMLVLLFLFI